MELVYLWVEDYKNIHKQGFNFSPRFECELKAEYEKDEDGKEKLKDDCELVIKPKEHLENFFGENINVTAIVGKNGSGKSSLLELITNKHEVMPVGKFFFIYSNNTNIYITNDNSDTNISTNNIKIIDRENLEKEYKIHVKDKCKDVFKNLISVFFSDVLNKLSIDLKPKELGSETPNPVNISTASMLNNIKPIRKMETNHGESSETGFNKIYQSYNIDQISKSVLLIKDNINLPFSHPKNIFIKNIDFTKHLINDYASEDKLIIELKTLFPKNAQSDEKNRFIKKLQQNIIISLMLSIPRYSTEGYLAKTDDIAITDLLKNLKNKPFENKLQKIIESYSFTFKNNNKNTILENLKKLVETISNFKEDFFINDELLLNINTQDFEFLALYENIALHMDKFLELNWEKQLSSGEESYMYQFARFRFYIKDYEAENTKMYIGSDKHLIILIDEGELTLHPQWQKDYVNHYIKFFTENKLAKTVHLIITSHSPFILSDLPKENVLFLEKDKKTGNCINVTSKTNIETFGANIHTLLSHGFFMKDGLMGEFAKGRINEAIKYLNQKTLTEKEIEYCENIISIVGEPILKRQLQRMLDSKRLSEVEQIKKQIEKLQDELAKKEDKKND